MNKQKFLLLSSLFLIGNSLAFSQSFPGTSAFQGVMVSIAPGLIDTNFKAGQVVTLDVPLGIIVSLTTNTTPSDVNAIGSVGMGYFFEPTPRFIVGIKGTADVENTSFNQMIPLDVDISASLIGSSTDIRAQLANNITAKLTNTFAILFEPGYAFDRFTMGYGVVGVRWGHFKSTTQGTVNANLAALGVGLPNINNGLPGRQSGYQAGITGGVGIERMVTRNFSLSLEYDYTNYGKIPIPGTSTVTVFTIPLPTPVPVNLLNGSTFIKAQTNTGLINFTYRFS